MGSERTPSAPSEAPGVFWAGLPADGAPLSGVADIPAAVSTCMDELRITYCNSVFSDSHVGGGAEPCVGLLLRRVFASPARARRHLTTLLGAGTAAEAVELACGAGPKVRVQMLSHVVCHEQRLLGVQGVTLTAEGETRSGPADGVPILQASHGDLESSSLLGAVDQCECCAIVADLAGTILHANAAKARLFGCTKDSLVGANVSVFRAPGQERIEKDMEFSTLTNGAWSGELLRRRPDGDVFPVHMKTFLLHDAERRPIAQLRVFYDLSAQERLRGRLQEQSEALRSVITQRTRVPETRPDRYRILYENSPVGTIIASAEGVIIEANPATCKILRRSREDLLGQHLSSLCAAPERYGRLVDQLTSGARVADEEVEYVSGAGETLSVQQSSVLADMERPHSAVVHFIRDVTREKELLREAGEAREQVARADRLASLGQLVAGVAHELNNPLTAVLTYAHLLKKKMGSQPEVARQLDLILEGGSRCRKVVSDLLGFARLTAATRTPTDANETIRHVLGLLENEFLIHRVTVEVQLQPDLPPILVDRHQVEQVFVNICMNAVEAMPHGGSLCVTSAHDATARLLNVGFRDAGTGILEEVAGKIFDPFFTTKAPGRGTGLGLAVSHRIVDEYGGHIHVDSQPGKGALFTVELPVNGPTEGKE